MSAQWTVLRVLISCPSDVETERNIAHAVIEDLNKTVAHPQDLHLDTLDWRDSVYPNLGGDPQAVVNEQIGDYEIFVGILGARFGSRTPRAGSGTEEEFNSASKRFAEEPDQMRVLTYFKTGNVDLRDINPEQLSKVIAFKGKVGSLGIYSEYASTDHFRTALLGHLASIIHEWGSTWGRGGSAPKVDVDEPAEEADSAEPDEGFLDLVERSTDSLGRSNEITLRIVDAIEQLGNDTQRRNEELQNLGPPQDRAGVTRTKAILNRAAIDMLRFVKRVDEDVPIFASAYSSAVDAYTRSASLLPMFGGDEEQLTSARDVMTTMARSLKVATDSIRSLRRRVASLPPVTTMFSDAQRKTLKALDGLISEFDGAISQARDADLLLQTVANRASAT